MKKDNKTAIFVALKSLLAACLPRLKARQDTEKRFDIYGRKKVTVGKKEVDGMYFASAIIQKNFVGFYFFPNYTHPMEFADMPGDLRKCLKGKSCFHIMRSDAKTIKEIRALLKKGMNIYKKEGWI